MARQFRSIVMRAQYPMDKYVLWIALALSAIGVMAVYSAIAFLAEVRADGDTEQYLWRHLLRLGVALTTLVIFSRIDYHYLARWANLFLIASLLLLVLVRLFGVSYGGATRAFQYSFISLQPSDLAKVAAVLYISVLLVRKQEYINSFFRSVIPILFWVFITVVLIGLEDLSTAILVLITLFLLAYIGRVSLKYLSGGCLVGIGCALVMLLASPNRAERVESYLGVKIFPTTQEIDVFNLQAEGYQAHQAQIALAMGGWTGRGPGKSIQRDFLPAPYNDFIFAIITEEYGLIGSLLLLGLFMLFLFRGFLRIARHAADPLGLFLAVGCTTLLFLYSLIHAGVSVGILPVTGLPLPLVSYGGTSMASAGMLIGILLNISMQSDK